MSLAKRPRSQHLLFAVFDIRAAASQQCDLASFPALGPLREYHQRPLSVIVPNTSRPSNRVQAPKSISTTLKPRSCGLFWRTRVCVLVPKDRSANSQQLATQNRSIGYWAVERPSGNPPENLHQVSPSRPGSEEPFLEVRAQLGHSETLANIAWSLQRSEEPLREHLMHTWAYRPAYERLSHGVSSPTTFPRQGQRPTPSLPHSAVLRLQVFSTSWRLAPPKPSRPCFMPNPSMGLRLSGVSPSR